MALATRTSSCFRLSWHAAVLILALLAMAVAAAHAAGRVPYGKGLLWRIEHPGVAPSYVFGTMHVNDPRVRTLPAPVRAAFNRAKLTVYEVIITPDVQRQLGESQLLPESHSLDKILGVDLFEEVAELASKRGISRERLRRLKPWTAYIALHFPQSEIWRLQMGELPLDQWMQSNAIARGVPVLQLETPEEQIAIFDDTPEAEQVAMLREGMADFRRVDEYLDDMTGIYVAGDTGTFYTQFYDSVNASGSAFARDFAERILDNRNRIMVERMQGMLREGGAFIAVGALHLPGDQGILRLLQRQGYSIVRAY